MPGNPLPVIGTNDLTKAYAGDYGGGEFGNGTSPGTPTQAARGWHDLNMAVAATMPTALHQSGAYMHATLTVLRRRSKVRR